MVKSYRIAAIPGDGIGNEVIPAGIEVLNDENAAGYWERSDQFDMALDLTAGRLGLAALQLSLLRQPAGVQRAHLRCRRDVAPARIGGGIGAALMDWTLDMDPFVG